MQYYPDQPYNQGYTPNPDSTPLEPVTYPPNEYGNRQMYQNIMPNNNPTMRSNQAPIPSVKKRNTLRRAIIIVACTVLLISALTATVFVSYNYGNSAGYAQGQNAGYSSGYSTGKSDGYTKGHADGYAKGYPDGQANIKCWVMQKHAVVYNLYFNNAFAGTKCS